MAGAAGAIRLAAAERRFLARRPPGRIHRRKAELAREEFLARPHALLLCHMPRRPAVSAEVPTAWRKWVAPEFRRQPPAPAGERPGGRVPCWPAGEVAGSCGKPSAASRAAVLSG